MTTAQPTSTKSVNEVWDPYNVIAVSFADDRDAYKALTTLKELHAQGRVEVQEAVVVARDQDGRVVEKDSSDSMFMAGTAGGGLIGLLIGIIGGPLGMLIGGTSGLLFGSLFDVYSADETESALGAVSSSVKPGSTSLLAVVTEQSPEVIDAAMSEGGGTVLRRAVADVEGEIAAAEEAQRKAKLEARKELVRERHEHDKAAVSAKLDELKAKLHQKPGAAGAAAATASDG